MSGAAIMSLMARDIHGLVARRSAGARAVESNSASALKHPSSRQSQV